MNNLQQPNEMPSRLPRITITPRATEPQEEIPLTHKTPSQGFGQPLPPGKRPPGPFKGKYRDTNTNRNTSKKGGKRTRRKTTKKRRTKRMRKSRRHR
jgi:hypothetical protein